jgi:hypothetical protein
MSGIAPFFLTGANAKIKINGKTMAFCTDLSYSVQILTQTPKVLGMYEGSSVEPLGYSVSGSFSIIRYAKGAREALPNHPVGTTGNDAGNGVGNWGNAWGGDGVINAQGLIEQVGIGNSGRANEALNPSKLGNATTFDIQVYQKVHTEVKTGVVTSGISNLADLAMGGQYGQAIVTADQSEKGVFKETALIGIANIRNCRITQADFSLTKKGAAVQRFNFVALYVDEDSFAADFSGRGQQL